jgi:hypothetical protein
MCGQSASGRVISHAERRFIGDAGSKADADGDVCVCNSEKARQTRARTAHHSQRRRRKGSGRLGQCKALHCCINLFDPERKTPDSSPKAAKPVPVRHLPSIAYPPRQVACRNAAIARRGLPH